MNRGGEPGLELSSRVVTVSTTDGVCPAREAGSVGAERFVATITHTGEVGGVRGGWCFVATITHTGEVGSVGGGFVVTITHTGEVGSVCVGGGTLWLPLPIQVRWGVCVGGGALCVYHYPYR